MKQLLRYMSYQNIYTSKDVTENVWMLQKMYEHLLKNLGAYVQV